MDNSINSTGNSQNIYVCEDTEDKIFLLSYSEATNYIYGFNANGVYDVNRRMKASDYALANGVYRSYSDDSYYSFGNSPWWLRTPSYENSYSVNYILPSGNQYVNMLVSECYLGVIPAMWIQL